MNIVVTGGSGFLGRRIVTALEGEHTVRVLTRQEPSPASVLAAADAVIHLAGEPVAQRWTEAARGRIRDSRVLGTRHLVAGLAAAPARPRVLVSASAIGIYGTRGDEPLTESSRSGFGFLPEVCAAWEHEAAAAERWGARVVLLRTGIVLAPGGGALARMLPAFRLGAGGRLGDGRQWMSWIHAADLVELVRFALTHPLRGALNAVAPEPVTNREFTRLLARALRRPAVLPVPAVALRLLFGEMSEVLLASQRVLPRAAIEAGFRFAWPRLGPALANLFGRPMLD